MKSKVIIYLCLLLTTLSCKEYSKVEHKALEELLKSGVAESEIDDITSEPCDSMLSPMKFGWLQIDITKSVTSFLKDEITKDSCISVINKNNIEAEDIMDSYNYGCVVNDSLHSVYKGSDDWRKVYKVNVKMKSGTVHSVKVITDRDGQTPVFTERELTKKAEEYQRSMLDNLKIVLE